MSIIDLSKIYTVEQLKRAVSETGSHFFDKDTMRFFKSRVAPGVIHTDTGLVFITSEQFETWYPSYYRDARKYTVRKLTEFGDIVEIGEFQQYDSLYAARKAAKEYGKFVHSLP